MPDQISLLSKLIVVWCCVIGAAAGAQDSALPPLPDETAAEFPAIGRLALGGFRVRQGCTATLIAPDLVLTAAHCVSETGQSARVFAAGWSRGDYIAARGTKEEIRHPKYGAGGQHGPRNDIALVILESPIDDVTPIPLGSATAHELDGTETALIGYHRRTPHILSGDFSCPVRRLHVGLLHVGCPVINGNSGAPLLTPAKDGGWQIVGVISSQLDGSAVAVELPVWLARKVATHLAK